jgi:hypothetical protein
MHDNLMAKIVAHPEFERLRAEKKKLDEQCAPLEGRKAQVSREFYDLRVGEKTLGFIIAIESIANSGGEYSPSSAVERSLVFNSEGTGI